MPQPSKEFLRAYAAKMMTATVLVSWLGLEMLALSFFVQTLGEPEQTRYLQLAGGVIFLYGATIFLRLKRSEAEPTREAGQLIVCFCIAVIAALSLFTYGVLYYFLATERNQTFLLNVSPVVSAAYAVLLIVWLKNTVVNYTPSRPGTFSFRVMAKLRALFITPYFGD